MIVYIVSGKLYNPAEQTFCTIADVFDDISDANKFFNQEIDELEIYLSGLVDDDTKWMDSFSIEDTKIHGNTHCRRSCSFHGCFDLDKEEQNEMLSTMTLPCEGSIDTTEAKIIVILGSLKITTKEINSPT